MRTTLTVSVALLAALAGGCGGGTGGPAGPGPGPQGSLTLLLDHEVDGAPLLFDTLAFQTPDSLPYQVETLVYYLSDLALRRPDGTFHETEGVHYRDARLGDTRAWTLAEAPNGAYDAVRFTFGLDEGWNVNGALPFTIEHINMQWPDPWGGGYHYMRFEGKYVAAPDTLEAIALHTGAGIPEGDTIRYHHFFSVTLPAEVTIAGDAWEIRLVMDLNEWFEHPQPYRLPDHPGVIMRDLPAQLLLEANGQDVFSVAASGPGIRP